MVIELYLHTFSRGRETPDFVRLSFFLLQIAEDFNAALSRLTGEISSTVKWAFKFSPLRLSGQHYHNTSSSGSWRRSESETAGLARATQSLNPGFTVSSAASNLLFPKLKFLFQ